jgi:succinate dehydrogenase assembly factor 2
MARWLARPLARALSSRAGGPMRSPSMVDLSRFADRGGAGAPGAAKLPQAALDRDVELRREHFNMRGSFPEAAQPSEGPRIDQRAAHRKRLVYRAKQRGWLEVDLLLGSFAVDHVPAMSDEEAAQFEAILNCETLDIYNMITKQMQVPKVLQTHMMTRLQEYAQTSPAGQASPSMYELLKRKMSN